MKAKLQMRSIAPALLCVAAALMGPFAVPAAVKSDFNGDGWGDLAVGVRYDDVNAQASAGAVNVIYGSMTGLSASNSDFITQGFGCPESAEPEDNFGYALATGYFNNDQYSDLAVGAPNEDLSGVSNAGIVQIFYGSANGLTCAGALSLQQTGGAMADDDRFGQALATGDFNQDGLDDLAIGAPGDHQSIEASKYGTVMVLYGGNGGLDQAAPTTKTWQLVDSPGMVICGASSDNNEFGFSLAAGNFGRGPAADLAIGIRHRKVGSAPFAGAVSIIYGSIFGLSPIPPGPPFEGGGSQCWTQSSLRGSVAENWDQFGYALAAGDFGKGKEDDLAIGSPGENSDTGIVHLLYGASGGLVYTGQKWKGGAKRFATAQPSWQPILAIAAKPISLSAPRETTLAISGTLDRCKSSTASARACPQRTANSLSSGRICIQ